MLYAIVVVLLLIADQGLKYWVTVHVALNEGRHVLIPKVLDVMNIHNYGIAFSWLQNWPSWVFAIIAAAFAVVVVLALKRGMIQGRFGRWMAVVALAGAIGNCIDRVLSGYVVDMLAFAFWKSFPVFNLADACLVVGGIAFCLYVIFHKEPLEQAKKPAAERKEKTQKRAEKKAVEAAEDDDKPSLSAKLAEKREALRKSAAARAEQRREAESRRAAEPETQLEERRRKPAPAAQSADEPMADPFAAWDRAVSERDANAKAEAERKAKLRAEREAKRKAEEAARAKAEDEAAKAEAQAAKAEARAAEKPAAPAEPAVDSAPTRKVAAKKIEEMAAKLAPKKPAAETASAPAKEKKPATPAEPEEEPVSYDLEDILREFADL